MSDYQLVSKEVSLIVGEDFYLYRPIICIEDGSQPMAGRFQIDRLPFIMTGKRRRSSSYRYLSDNL